ncbi:hypothetical protein PV350_19425 [Streptomyces sp. PA03-6a]|nr:hypothetical protein [Streptomyces sp. PA03-6a]
MDLDGRIVDVDDVVGDNVHAVEGQIPVDQVELVQRCDRNQSHLDLYLGYRALTDQVLQVLQGPDVGRGQAAEWLHGPLVVQVLDVLRKSQSYVGARQQQAQWIKDGLISPRMIRLTCCTMAALSDSAVRQ